MKMPVMLGVSLGLLAASMVHAASNDLIGLSTPNGKAAADMLDLWFNQHNPGEAFDKYVSRSHLTTHFGKQTTHSFEQTRAEEIKMTGPNLHFEIKKIVAQGDLVFAHIHVTNGKPGFGNELVEIMRFNDGKMVEHWDIHVPLQQDAKTYFGD